MIFFKGKKVYHKSAITQLWHVQTKFETLSDDVNLKFKCRVCGFTKPAPFKALSNLNKHKCCPEIINWHKNSEKARGKLKPVLSDEVLRLIKYIVNSNISLSDLKNPEFHAILDKKIQVPSYHIFRNRLLPEVLQKLHRIFTCKLNTAVSIALVTDIWTNRSNSDFIALGAVICKADLSKELIIIGLERMKGSHCAENIRSSINEMTNKYDFDKSKIVGQYKTNSCIKKCV